MSRGGDDDRGDARSDLRGQGVVRPDDARDPDLRSSDLPDGRFSLPSGLDRQSISGRDRSYHLRDSESHTLETLATFQIVFDRDLREGRYRDDDDRLDDDLRSLVRQGLVESRTITADHHGHSMRVLALSDDGRDLLQDHRRSAGFLSGGSEVRVHSGFGKRSDLIHNASLYRMYQVEAAAIERRGGTIRSVVLEGDLKCEVYHRAQPGGALSDDLRHALLFEAAHRCEIPVVNDHLEFPDIRVEYDMPRGHGGRVDLELITAQYRGGAIAAKAAAGFTMYSAGGSASRGIHGLGGSDGCRGSAGHWYDRSLSGLLSL
jgi:hypothetical protein